jgi:hypothetical protein
VQHAAAAALSPAFVPGCHQQQAPRSPPQSSRELQFERSSARGGMAQACLPQLKVPQGSAGGAAGALATGGGGALMAAGPLPRRASSGWPRCREQGPNAGVQVLPACTHALKRWRRPSDPSPAHLRIRAPTATTTAPAPAPLCVAGSLRAGAAAPADGRGHGQQPHLGASLAAAARRFSATAVDDLPQQLPCGPTRGWLTLSTGPASSGAGGSSGGSSNKQHLLAQRSATLLPLGHAPMLLSPEVASPAGPAAVMKGRPPSPPRPPAADAPLPLSPSPPAATMPSTTPAAVGLCRRHSAGVVAAAAPAASASEAAPVPPPRAAGDSFTASAVAERTHAWMALLARMQATGAKAGAGGELQEFVYLKYAAPCALPFNPFDLEVRRVEAGGCRPLPLQQQSMNHSPKGHSAAWGVQGGRFECARCGSPTHAPRMHPRPAPKQVADYSEVACLPAFLTVSTTGVTRTVRLPALGASATEFVGLAQFRREAALHANLVQLAVFR